MSGIKKMADGTAFYSWDSRREYGAVFRVMRYPYMNKQVGCPMHGQDFSEIVFVESGQCNHHINGEIIEMHRGHMILMREQDIHGFSHVDDNGFTLLSIQFQTHVLNSLHERYFTDVQNFFGGDLPVCASKQLTEQQYDQLVDEASILAQAEQIPFYIDRFLMIVLDWVYPRREAHSDVMNMPVWLKSACLWIHDPRNFSKGVKQFVKFSGKSSHHVTRELKKHMGMTATEFINKVRIEYAARKLAETEDTLDEIARDCGYSSRAYFFKRFRERYKMTPKEYRRKNRRTIPTFRSDSMVKAFRV